MRTLVAIACFVAFSSRANAQAPNTTDTAPNAAHSLGIYGALFAITDLHLESERGALLGGALEARFLFQNRIGIGVVPFSFSYGDLGAKRGRFRRHGIGPRLQLLPVQSRFDLTMGYDLNYVVYADGDEYDFILPSVAWDERQRLAHSFSARLNFLVGSDRASQKPFGFLIGLIAIGGWTADRSTWWVSAGISFGGRLRTSRPEHSARDRAS